MKRNGTSCFLARRGPSFAASDRSRPSVDAYVALTRCHGAVCCQIEYDA